MSTSYFLTFLFSLSHGKGTKNTCKIDATVNFFSAVAGNFSVKTKRMSNLESYNFILCFATSTFYYVNNRAWGEDLIVSVDPGVGHLADLVLQGEGIFEYLLVRCGDIRLLTRTKESVTEHMSLHRRKMSAHALLKMTRDLFWAMSLALRQKCRLR